MKVYIVGYSTGSYSDYRENTLFVTDNKDYADKYAVKLNIFSEKVNQYCEVMEERRPLYSDKWYGFISSDRTNLIYEFSSRHGEFEGSFVKEVDFRK